MYKFVWAHVRHLHSGGPNFKEQAKKYLIIIHIVSNQSNILIYAMKKHRSYKIFFIRPIFEKNWQFWNLFKQAFKAIVSLFYYNISCMQSHTQRSYDELHFKISNENFSKKILNNRQKYSIF